MPYTILDSNTSGIICLPNSTSPDCWNVSHTGQSMFLGTPEAYVVPAVFLVIFIIGVLGNGALIFIVACNASMRNVPNILIVNLACGDLLLILVSVPFTATIYTLAEWPYGDPMCRVNEFLQCMSLGVSVFTLIALSLDRYVAIAHPLSRRKNSPVCRTTSLAVAIWFLSVLLAVPVAVVSHVEYYPDGPHGDTVGICVRQPHAWSETYRRWQAMINFIVFFAVPMLIIGGLYALMARILIASSSNMPGVGNASTAARTQTETRNKVARLVLSFVAVFVVCWLPRHIYVLWYHLAPGEYNMFWHVFKMVSFCLSFINSCVNPLALYFLSHQFRRHYNNVLFCCCRPRHVSAGRVGSFVDRHKLRLKAPHSKSSDRSEEFTSFITSTTVPLAKLHSSPAGRRRTQDGTSSGDVGRVGHNDDSTHDGKTWHLL